MKALRIEYVQILTIIANAKEIPPLNIREELLKQGIEMRRQYLHARLQVLLNKAYVQKRHLAGITYYSITLTGALEFARANSHHNKNLLRTNAQPPMKPKTARQEKSTGEGVVIYKAKRLEAYRFDYPLVHHLGDEREDKVMLVRAAGLSFSINAKTKNHETITIHYEIEARISTNYLSLHIPAKGFPYGFLSKEDEAQLRKEADKHALKLEHRLNQARFKLFNAQKRRGIYQNFEIARFEGELICEIGDSEIAEEDHLAAKMMKAKGIKQFMVKHPKTGNDRMKLLCESHGTAHTEFFHATEEGVAQDSDTWDKQIALLDKETLKADLNALLSGHIKLQDIGTLKSAVLREAEEIGSLKNEQKEVLTLLQAIINVQQQQMVKEDRNSLENLRKNRLLT